MVGSGGLSSTGSGRHWVAGSVAEFQISRGSAYTEAETYSGAAPDDLPAVEVEFPPELFVAPDALRSLMMSLASPLVIPSLIWSSAPRREMNCFWFRVASWLAEGPVGMVEPDEE